MSRIVGDDKTHSLANGAKLIAWENTNVSVTDRHSVNVNADGAIVSFCSCGVNESPLTFANRTDNMAHVIWGWLPGRSRLWRRRWGWGWAGIVVNHPTAENGGRQNCNKSFHPEASLTPAVSK